MNNREIKTLSIIYILAAVVFITAFLVIPFEKNAASWIAFSFAVLSIIVGFCISYVAVNKGKDIKSKIYGFPLFRLGYYYTIVQIIVAVVISGISAASKLPVWLPVLVGVILLAVVIAGAVTVENAREYIVNQEARDSIKTGMMDQLKIEAAGLVGKCTDSEVRNMMENLAEEIKYSDPVSNPQLVEIEGKISVKINELSMLIGADSEGSKACINELSELVKNRNRMCKMLK